MTHKTISLYLIGMMTVYCLINSEPYLIIHKEGDRELHKLTDIDSIIFVDTILGASIDNPTIQSTVPNGEPNVSYTFAANGGICINGGGTQYRFDWNTGVISSWGNSSQASYLWSSTGIYNIRAQSRCSDSTNIISNWSTPTTFNVISSSNIRYVTGLRSTDEQWSRDTIYVVAGGTYFEDDASLTIEAGTLIRFENGSLSVGKNFTAVGSVSDSIYFENGIIQTRWHQLDGVSYNPDYTYKEGPRLEYCSLSGSILEVFYDSDLTNYSGWGFYLKNSSVDSIRSSDIVFRRFRGGFIDSSIIGGIDLDFSTTKGIIRNSYIGSFRLSGSTVEVMQCLIESFSINTVFSLNLNEIHHNDIGRLYFYADDHSGNLSNNNFIESTQLGIFNGEPDDVSMTGNYWGPSATSEMDALGNDANISIINDFYDDFSLGRIDYSNWSNVPILNSGPDW